MGTEDEVIQRIAWVQEGLTQLRCRPVSEEQLMLGCHQLQNAPEYDAVLPGEVQHGLAQ